MSFRGPAIFLLTIACTAPALADDVVPCCRPSHRSRSSCTTVCPSLGGSPDDYCRKTAPHITDVSRCGGPDDYCRKAAPHITDVPRCGGPDDYCRKSMPTLLCPPASPYLLYGPSRPCGGGCK